MKKKIFTEKSPKAIGPYSQAIQVNQMVYFSGQIPLDANTMTLAGSDFKVQAVQVIENIKAICMAAGGDLSAIVKLTIYLTDLADFAILNEVLVNYFNEPYPARTTIQVAALPKDAKIEIEALMILQKV